MRGNRFSTDILPALFTALAGIATLAAILLARDQLPLDRSVARVLGLFILYLGMALFAWAALHLRGAVGGFVAPRSPDLVVTGPYNHVRHPIYLGTTIAMLGAAITTRSILGLAATLLVFLPVEIHRARLEERALHERFGEVWQSYAARTGFFLPRLSRTTPPADRPRPPAADDR
jgi:protein-S-isoprenylcysteine O-methyltransferase Ste14